MSFLNAQPARRQVVAVACLLLLPLAAAVVWSASQTRTEREAELRDEAATIATTSVAYLNQYLAGVDSFASALVRHPSVRALQRDACDRLFAGLLEEQPLMLNIALSGADGSLRGSGRKVPEGVDPPLIAARPYVTEVIRTGRSVVSELTIGLITRKPTMILGYPVLDDGGRVVGALGLGLDLGRLQTVFASIPLPEGSVITLTDRTGHVLARSLDAERFIGTTMETRLVDPNQVPRQSIGTGSDGIERVVGTAVVDRGPWVLSVGIPSSVITARLAPLGRRNLAISLSALAATFFLSLWIAHQMSRQLNRLRTVTQRIANGDFSPPDRGPVANRELAQLQDAFVTMAENLQSTRNALDRQVEEERKTREALQSLQRQVVRQERLAAVGLLVSGVAHELNNPLQAILGMAELLEREQGLSAEALEDISCVKTQSGRAREIIRNLSRFSGQQSGPPTLVDLRDVIAEVVQHRGGDLSASAISLDVELVATRKVSASFTELEQVTLNFLINAQQAIAAAGRRKGRVLMRLVDAGKRVRVEVLDNGPGVKPEDERKLFQPFFTTKPVGKGTGLGLSVSYGIIDSYGGTIGYRENEWGGALFFFELPAVDAGVTLSSN